MTTKAPAPAAASAIADATVPIDLGRRSYNIHVGRDLLARIANLLPFSLAGRTLFIVTDDNAGTHYAEGLHRSLADAGARQVHVLSLPPGEGSKSFARLQEIVGWMIDHGVDRDSVLFALGGGVVGDLSGFAAAIVMRGIHYVQVPTTLLAQVDSSVGGKTAINLPQGKNMAGLFHQPAAVICDIDTLETLPAREIRAGYAEIAKYGLINDPEFFFWLEKQGAAVCARDPAATVRAVQVSCMKKAEIVSSDEREQGARALLNLGHTFGHALEAAAGYDGRLLHGEAVAIGMVMAFRLSVRLGICPPADADRVAAHLAAAGLPVNAAAIAPLLSGGAGELMEFMARDKKATQGHMKFVLVNGIGKAHVTSDVAGDDVTAVLVHSLRGEN